MSRRCSPSSPRGRARVRRTISSVWTKYFELEPVAEEEVSASREEDSKSGEDNAQLDDINIIASC